jgi:hypothetical protein
MKSNNIILTVAETLVIGGIIFAFVSPLFSPSEENNTQESSVERSHGKRYSVFPIYITEENHDNNSL